MTCNPHLTVAAIIEEQDRYLMVEEISNGIRVLNQPAGHWEASETGPKAIIRETLEETGYDFTPTEIVGIYSWTHPETNDTYVRVTYTGQVGEPDPNAELDAEIIQTKWMSYEQIQAAQNALRSPLVLQCLDDYRRGQRYDLSLIYAL